MIIHINYIKHVDEARSLTVFINNQSVFPLFNIAINYSFELVDKRVNCPALVYSIDHKETGLLLVGDMYLLFIN